jgi:hypothetical protein
MSQTPTDSPYRWRAADLEGIRVALSIPARMPAIRAINDSMANWSNSRLRIGPAARPWRSHAAGTASAGQPS